MTPVRSLVLLFVMVTVPAAAAAQQRPEPEMDRPIKALSDQEILQYLNGDEMGWSRTADLNRYPGPRAVLELANELGLTEPQRQRVRRIQERTHDAAAALGKEIVSREAVLDSLFSTLSADTAQVRVLSDEIGRLQGDLRATHLGAHLEVTRLLARDQLLAWERYLVTHPAAKGAAEQH